MKLFVVTGASRGMGAALAEQLLADAGHTLLCIARRSNAALGTVAAASGATLEQWQADLAAPVAVAARLGDWLAARDSERFTQATLINNAGVLTTIGPLEGCSLEELSAALRVGLEAPLLLTAAFLRATAGWRGERRVLNISSGLGRRAMAGQATYCAAKAGMDHFTRAVALDQALVAERREGRLARARRDRHRHAGAAARQRRQRLSRSGQLRQAEGGGPAELEP